MESNTTKKPLTQIRVGGLFYVLRSIVLILPIPQEMRF